MGSLGDQFYIFFLKLSCNYIMFSLPFPLSNLFGLSFKFMVSFFKIVSYTHRNFVNKSLSPKVKPMESHYETNRLCLWHCYVREDLRFRACQD